MEEGEEERGRRRGREKSKTWESWSDVWRWSREESGLEDEQVSL